MWERKQIEKNTYNNSSTPLQSGKRILIRRVTLVSEDMINFLRDPILHLRTRRQMRNRIRQRNSNAIMARKVKHKDIAKDLCLTQSLLCSRRAGLGFFFRGANHGIDEVTVVALASCYQGFFFLDGRSDMRLERIRRLSDQPPLFR